MDPVVLPIRELFTRPAEAFRRLKDSHSLPGLLALYLLMGIIGYVLSKSFFTFDALKTTDIYLRKISIYWSYPALYLAGAAFVFATLMAATGLSYATGRFAGGKGSFSSLLACFLFISVVAHIFNDLLFVFSFGKLFLPALYYIRQLVWVVWGWQVYLSVVAVREVHELDLQKAVITVAVAKFIQWVLFAGILIVGLVGFYLKHALPGKMSGLLPPPRLEVINQPADLNWAVASLDGTFFPLPETKGKAIFLNFWATWCPPCVAEMPSIQAAYDRLKDQNILFVCVSDEKADTVKKFQEKHGYTFPVYILGEKAPAVFATSAVPTTFLISASGQIVAKHVGGAKWDSEEALKALRSLTAR
jgi:thiol-disulfide isomerase/thioredoxin